MDRGEGGIFFHFHDEYLHRDTAPKNVSKKAARQRGGQSTRRRSGLSIGFDQ